MLNFSRGGTGCVIVKTNSLHDSGTGFRGINGQELVSDVTFDPQRHARTHGEVIHLPLEMGSAPLYQKSAGVPGYGAIRKYKDHDMEEPNPAIYTTGGVHQYKFMSDIKPEVEIGDKIYFSWRIAYSPNNILAVAGTGDKAQYLLKVPYDQIYCAVRDGKIIPVASHVLIDPEIEQWEDILTPTYYNQVDEHGKPIPRPKDQWIQTKRFPENKDRTGTIAHIGSPLNGEPCELKPGDRVIYRVLLKNVKNIEGNKYTVIPQRKILLKLKD